MSDTHQWLVQISPGQVIAGIHISSIFYAGPFSPGSTEIVMYLAVENIGDIDGDINWALYEYPGSGTMEQLINSGMIFCGVTTPYCTVGDVPATIPFEIDSYPLGLKVWGETETEPSWGAMGTFMWGQPTERIILA